MLLSRLAKNIIESMSQIPVDELDFMTRSELLQLCKDHNIEDVEDKSNRDLIKILTDAAERTVETKPVRARSLSMISIDEETFKFLEFKALPSPPPIPEDINNDDDSSSSGGSNADDDNSHHDEHGVDNDDNIDDDDDDDDAKSELPSESNELPRLYFTLREISVHGDTESEGASSRASSGPSSPITHNLPGASIDVALNSMTAYSPQKAASSDSVGSSNEQIEEARRSPGILYKSDDAALPSIPVDTFPKSITMDDRADSQETVTEAEPEKVLTEEEQKISDWLQEHGLSIQQARLFAREDMLDWDVLQVATLDGFRALGLTVGRGLKLLAAIHDRFVGAPRVLSAEHVHEITMAVEASVKQAIQAIEPTPTHRSLTPSSQTSTPSSTPASTPGPSRTPSMRHSRSMSSTRVSSSQAEIKVRETKTSSARARAKAKSTITDAPASPPPFITSFSLEEQLKASRMPTVVKPLPPVSSSRQWAKPGAVPVVENRAALLRKLSKQKLRAGNGSVSESTTSRPVKSKSTGSLKRASSMNSNSGRKADESNGVIDEPILEIAE
ncbi:hypothetical protein BDF19DRAFT_423970 [Syncephalis fuscata]|nr:hypothetical protein BDF19DRAFT_423970 [Syncephalis fuscata]